ncbi:YbdD/YjiX family protein [Antrihabitans sp. YC2-6]|uniref:YbdD/YjiX family protein n=1 Tax=Antrihabitans sp. YC2-6 TaxID=2799498 RepID=UPI0018F28EEB|nr:YbdD/YjiX family protein [Antrihabitans sp. YC2-6]MBJ8343739.1 YbdD/YjiX family protein [Antrihabitans sp. YC2-6]
MSVKTAARSFAWWFTSVMGDRDYSRYVTYMQARHPGEPIACEREYWRSRHADAELNPRSRCC